MLLQGIQIKCRHTLIHQLWCWHCAPYKCSYYYYYQGS